MALTVASCQSVKGVDWSQLGTILLDMDGTSSIWNSTIISGAP